MKKQTALKSIAILLLLLSIVCVVLCFSTLNGKEITYYRENLYNASDEIDDVNELIDELKREYGVYKRDGIELLEKTKDVYFGIIDDSLEEINSCYAKATVYGILSAVLFIAFIIVVIYCKKVQNKNKNSVESGVNDSIGNLTD